MSTESEIKVAVATAKQLFSNPKYNAKKFEVVICGKAVDSIKKNSEIQPAIQEGMLMGVDFKACGISFGNSKIAPEELIKGIEVVPNGLLRKVGIAQVALKIIPCSTIFSKKRGCL